MNIKIDDSKPIYHQIVEQILSQIKSGELSPGDRLPTERELAQSLRIARGTVKKAYKELSDNNIIEVIQGSGSYVYDDRGVPDVEKRRIAFRLIDELFVKLNSWGFSSKEISTLLRMSLAEKERSYRPIRVAVIDCNPESLAIFKRQLSYIPNILISVFMVESVIMDDDPASIFRDFDIVLTTATHYDQISSCLSSLKPPVFPVSVAPSRNTIVSIGALKPSSHVGIVCTSSKFANLICEQLNFFCPSLPTPPVNFETSIASAARFISRYKTIIISPDSLLFDSQAAGNVLEDFAASGGQIIPFDYLIDRASLMFVESQIDALTQQYLKSDI